MKHQLHTWALILAGGEGSRLQSLTKSSNGKVIPKQFCSLQGGPSLLEEALRRGRAVAASQRICAVVAQQHRVWWAPLLGDLAQHNIVVQPQNRGTAHGILLPLLRIVERDPDALVVLLPADHYVQDEAVMAAALRRSAELAAQDVESIFLLGIQPDEADTELGYIVPAASQHAPSAVLRFVEKPSQIHARLLLERGALWNSFIIAASARALLGLYDTSFATTIAAMRGLEGATIETAYENLPVLDFSRDVLQGRETALKVIAVPQCGWSDLGTPHRIGQTLKHVSRDLTARRTGATTLINLADAYARLHRPREPFFKFDHLDLPA